MLRNLHWQMYYHWTIWMLESSYIFPDILPLTVGYDCHLLLWLSTHDDCSTTILPKRVFKYWLMTSRTTDKKFIELFFKHNKLSLVYCGLFSDSSSFSVSVSDWLTAEPGMYASSILSPSESVSSCTEDMLFAGDIFSEEVLFEGDTCRRSAGFWRRYILIGRDGWMRWKSFGTSGWSY